MGVLRNPVMRGIRGVLTRVAHGIPILTGGSSSHHLGTITQPGSNWWLQSRLVYLLPWKLLLRGRIHLTSEGSVERCHTKFVDLSASSEVP